MERSNETHVVMVNYPMEALPIRSADTLDEAERIARRVPTSGASRRVQRMLGIECSVDPISVGVMSFRDGKPAGYTSVKQWA